MKLLTEIKIPHYPFRITYQDKLFFIGSCFSNEISEKFRYFGYQLLANPYGTVYNSRAIRQQIESIIDSQYDFTSWIQTHEGEHISLLHNTNFRNKDKNELFTQIQKSAIESRKAVKEANYLFLTLGTANVYRHKELNRIVANNQKLPASEFQRESLSVKEIIADLTEIKRMVHSLNPDCKIILTVSPVRHLKDGLIENQRTKAKLILATEEFCEVENAFYFPSYEIVLDELRDYRFYTKDLTHINELCVNYIWEKLKTSLLNETEEQARQTINKFRKLQQHKVVDESKLEEHETLVSKKKQKILKQYNIEIK